MISDSETRRGAGRFRYSLTIALALLAHQSVVFYAPPAAAQQEADATQDRSTARELALQGAQAFERGEWENALEMFSRAYTLYPAPTISIMQARSLAKLGRLLEALDKYEATQRTKLEADAPEAFQAAISEAATEAETVRARLPRVKLSVSGPGADAKDLRVIIDGKESTVALIGVDRPMDPGKHQFTVESPSGAKGTRELQVEESRSYLVELSLEQPKAVEPKPVVVPPPPAPLPERKPNRTLAYVAYGVGGAGLVLGGVTGIIALGKKGDLDDACNIGKNGCPPSSQSDLDAYRLTRTLSYVGFGIAAVGAIGGTVLLFTTGKSHSSTELRAYVAPSGAGLSGKF
jgi:hypothetical protein